MKQQIHSANSFLSYYSKTSIPTRSIVYLQGVFASHFFKPFYMYALINALHMYVKQRLGQIGNEEWPWKKKNICGRCKKV